MTRTADPDPSTLRSARASARDRPTSAGPRRTGAGLLALAMAVAPGWAVADLFTVGIGGSHASIQAAVDAAVAAGGNHEIRVRQGTYPGRVAIVLASGDLHLSGGWHAGFEQQTVAPANTQVLALATGRALDVTLAGGAQLTITGLAFTGGLVVGDTGAGVLVLARQASQVHFADVAVSLNQARVTSPSGAGVGFSGAVLEGSRITLERARFEENNITTDSLPARGAVALSAQFGSQLVVRDSWFGRNRVTPPQTDQALALLATVLEGRLLIDGNRFQGNVEATAQQPVVELVVLGSSQVVFERNRLQDNGQARQLLATIQNEQSTPVRIVGNLVFGAGTGLLVSGNGSTPAQVGWNTIVGHSGFGIGPSSFIHWHNNIVAFNGTDAAPTPPVPDTNLTDIDPGFVAPSRGDFRLRTGSPGHEAATPIAGWTTPAVDLDGVARPSGLATDIGAFEHDEDRLLFAGFED